MATRVSGYQEVDKTRPRLGIGMSEYQAISPEITETRGTGDAEKKIFSPCRRDSPSPCQMNRLGQLNKFGGEIVSTYKTKSVSYCLKTLSNHHF